MHIAIASRYLILNCIYTSDNIFFYRKVEARYPHFPADTAALYSVLSLPDVRAQSQDQIVLLSKFITKLPEMQITLPFLPDFIEFYQWLHKDLAGVLTPEKADKLSIKKLVDQMSRHYSGESGRKLKSLYEEVKCMMSLRSPCCMLLFPVFY